MSTGPLLTRWDRALLHRCFRRGRIALAFACVFGAIHARANVIVWLGGSRNWNDSGKWQGGSLPGSGDTAAIDNSNAATSSVTLNISPTISQLQISSGDSLTIASGQTL